MRALIIIYVRHTVSDAVSVMSQTEIFHPPKFSQQQRNGNKTAFQWVPIANPLNVDVAPSVDPVF